MRGVVDFSQAFFNSVTLKMKKTTLGTTPETHLHRASTHHPLLRPMVTMENDHPWVFWPYLGNRWRYKVGIGPIGLEIEFCISLVHFKFFSEPFRFSGGWLYHWIKVSTHLLAAFLSIWVEITSKLLMWPRHLSPSSTHTPKNRTPSALFASPCPIWTLPGLSRCLPGPAK